NVRVHVLSVGRTRHVKSTALAIGRLARLARGADLVHANDARAATFTQPAALWAGRPWIYHVRDLLTGSTRFEQAVRWTRPTQLLAISEAVKQQMLTFGGWDPRRVAVVRHGVEADVLAAQADRAAWRAEMGLEEADRAVGIVGRLAPWKGQDDFIRA